MCKYKPLYSYIYGIDWFFITPKPVNFVSNSNIRSFLYYNYRRSHSESYILAMEDFLDNSAFNRWRELLEENNYRKSGRPYEIPGIIILYLTKLRELMEIPGLFTIESH